MTVASQTRPEDAVSNIAAWVNYLGGHAPAWMQTSGIDTVVAIVGILIGVVGVFLAWRMLPRKKPATPDSAPAAPPPPAAGEEIEVVYAALDMAMARVIELLNERDALYEERERLRAALQAFAKHFGPLEDNIMLNDDVRNCYALARAALKETATPEARHDAI